MEKLFVLTVELSVERSDFLGKWRRKCYTTKYGVSKHLEKDTVPPPLEWMWPWPWHLLKESQINDWISHTTPEPSISDPSIVTTWSMSVSSIQLDPCDNSLQGGFPSAGCYSDGHCTWISTLRKSGMRLIFHLSFSSLFREVRDWGVNPGEGWWAFPSLPQIEPQCGPLMSFFSRGNIIASHSRNPWHFSLGKSPQTMFSYLYSNVILHIALWSSDSKTMCHAGPSLFSIPKVCGRVPRPPFPCWTGPGGNTRPERKHS